MYHERKLYLNIGVQDCPMFTQHERTQTMNTPNEHRLLTRELPRAIAALQDTTGLECEVVPIGREIAPGRGDALLEIRDEEQKHLFVVEAKTRVDRITTLGLLKAQLDQFNERPILFAPYITTAIAKECRKLNIGFLDTAGNAYLKAPGLLVFVAGEKPHGQIATALGTQGGGTATALRVVFAVLCQPALLNAPYRDIVDAAGVALGAVGWVFFDLQGRGYIAAGKRKRDRRLIEPIRLFEEWVTNYPIKLRPKLNARRFKAQNPDWWQHADLVKLGYWGGEVAGDRFTHDVKPHTFTIYIKPEATEGAFTRFVAAHRLRADPNGDIEILDAFWKLPADLNHPDVVPPILAYADLMATLDPRNIEAAKQIREHFIDHALRQA